MKRAGILALVVLTGLAATAVAQEGRGRRTRDRVEAQSTDIYEIVFKADKLAFVSVIGDGDTDLDLFVYDEAGNLVTSDEDLTDICFCSWTPDRTQKYRIELKNLGDVYNEYVMGASE